MSRLLRLQYEDALYHVLSRGNNKRKIFTSNADYELFLKFLSEAIKECQWVSFAYCLMPNHYHLVVKTPLANLAVGMKDLNAFYAQKFNFLHKRVGHLFQGRYKSRVITRESYLLTLIKYVALNPVRSGLVDSPEKWPWSSYSEIIQNVSDTGCVKKEKIKEMFGDLKGFKKFILD
jgi:putative transposase